MLLLCDYNTEDVCVFFFSFFFLIIFAHWDEMRGEGVIVAQLHVEKADANQMFSGRCARRENRTMPSPCQETMNTVCLTKTPIWSCFYL